MADRILTKRILLSFGLGGFLVLSLAASSNLANWQSNGPKIFYSAGEVGIGKNNPRRALDVKDKGKHTIRAVNSARSGVKIGVFAQVKSDDGRGVYGFAKSSSGRNYGVYGRSRSNNGFGVYGNSPGIGVGGDTDTANGGVGVLGFASQTSGDSIGVYGVTNSDDGFAGKFLGGTTFFDRTFVGIGTDTPEALLDIETSIATRMMQISADWPATDGQTIVRWIMDQSSVDTSSFLKLNRGNDTKFNFLANGDAACDGSFSGGGADYAEYLPVAEADESFEPGDVVGVRDGKISHRTDGAQRVLVISTDPVLVGNSNAEGEGEGEIVAMLGQVPVKVAGPVRSGDLIVASGLGDGLAVAVAPSDITAAHLPRIIGAAWESSESSGVNRINTAIGLDQHTAIVGIIDSLMTNNRQKDREIADLHDRLSALEAAVTRMTAAPR